MQSSELIYDGNLLRQITGHATGRISRYSYDLAGNRIAEETEVLYPTRGQILQ